MECFEALTGSKLRAQETYTPKPIVDALLKVWPEIALDPCSGPDSVVPARISFVAVPRVRIVTTPKGRTRTYHEFECLTEDGLTAPWVDYTYVNPPFSHLRPWLDKAVREGQAGREVVMLCPTRGHRTWTRDAWLTCASIIDLNPVKFVGFKSTHPEPLVMLYWGVCKYTFEDAFASLGGARQGL
jgi:hypothetical protein